MEHYTVLHLHFKRMFIYDNVDTCQKTYLRYVLALLENAFCTVKAKQSLMIPVLKQYGFSKMYWLI